MPARRLSLISLLVADYDGAIAWYSTALGFQLSQDTPLEDGKRWVVMTQPGGGSGLLLAKAVGSEQANLVGRQSGGRVFLFLETDDFARDHARMKAFGVEFKEEPRVERYGTVAVFANLYGNLWDLVEPAR